MRAMLVSAAFVLAACAGQQAPTVQPPAASTAPVLGNGQESAFEKIALKRATEIYISGNAPACDGKSLGTVVPIAPVKDVAEGFLLVCTGDPEELGHVMSEKEIAASSSFKVALVTFEKGGAEEQIFLMLRVFVDEFGRTVWHLACSGKRGSPYATSAKIYQRVSDNLPGGMRPYCGDAVYLADLNVPNAVVLKLPSDEYVKVELDDLSPSPFFPASP